MADVVITTSLEGVTQIRNSLNAIEANLKSIGNTGSQTASRVAAVGTTLDTVGQSVTRFGRQLLIGFTLPLTAAAGALVNFASDAVETRNLFEVSMRSMTEEADKFVENLITGLGQSRSEIQQSLGAFQNMLTAMGLLETEAFDVSKALVQLSIDMASFFNISGGTEGAQLKLQAGLVGSTEVLRRYGVIIDESVIKQIALNRGIISTGEELTQVQKVLLRFLVITEQTENSIGDFARTMESPANQMRITQAAVKNLTEELGTSLFPALVTILGATQALIAPIRNLAERFKELDSETQGLIISSVALAAALGPILLVFGPFLRIVGNLLRLVVRLAPAIAAVTLAMSPWLLAIGAIVAAASALNIAFKVLEATMTRVVEAVGQQWDRLRLLTAEGVLSIVESLQALGEKAGIAPSFLERARENLLAEIANLREKIAASDPIPLETLLEEQVAAYKQAFQANLDELLQPFRFLKDQISETLFGIEEVEAGSGRTAGGFRFFEGLGQDIEVNVEKAFQDAVDAVTAGQEAAVEALKRLRAETGESAKSVAKATGEYQKFVAALDLATEASGAQAKAAQFSAKAERILGEALDKNVINISQYSTRLKQVALEVQRIAREPFKDFVDGLKAQNDALRAGLGGHQAEVRLLEAETRLRERLGRELLPKEREELRKLIDENERLTRLKADLETAREQFLEPFKSAISSIQQLFANMFEQVLNGGIDTFGDFADAVKAIFIRLAAEIASLLVFRPVISGVLNSAGLGGLASLLGGGTIPNVGLGQASQFGSLLGDLTGVTSELGSAVNQLGAFLGFAPTTVSQITSAGSIGTFTSEAALAGSGLSGGSAGFLGNITLGSALGFAGLGALGGSVVGPLLGLDPIGSTVGGAAGAGLGAIIGAGAAVGGPVGALIGGLIGTIGGGFLGNLFGGQPSNFGTGATLTIDAEGLIQATRIWEDGANSATRNLRTQVIDAFGERLEALRQLLPTAQFSPFSVEFGVGQRDPFTIGTFTGNAEFFGFDPEALVRGLLRRVVDGITNLEEAITELPEAVDPAVQSLQNVINQMEKFKEVAEALGLPSELVEEREAAQLSESVSQLFDAFLNPIRDVLSAIEGGFLGVASPQAQLDFIRERFAVVSEAALAGAPDALRLLPQVAQQLLQTEQQFFGTGAAFGQALEEVQSVLSTVLTETESQQEQLFQDFGLTFQQTSLDQTERLEAALTEQTSLLKQVRDLLESQS